MSYYTYISEECNEDIKTYSCKPQIEKLGTRILETQTIAGFETFPTPFFVKKKFPADNLRTICYIHQIKNDQKDDDEVLIFLRVIKRDSINYKNFIQSPDKFHPSDDIKNKAEAIVREKQKVDPPKEKPSPSDEENSYLCEVFAQRDKKQDFFICESSEWVKNIRVKNEFFRSIRPIIERIIDDEKDMEVKEVKIDEYTLIYRNFGTYKKLFLAGLVKEHNVENIYKTYQNILSPKKVAEEELLKHSRRQYEWGILDSPDAWGALERDEDANLALSSEETAILQGVMQWANLKDSSNSNGFPLFINGRAGSGKSTILQYLFAYYLKFYLKNKDNMESHPIYFSCSQELIKKSKEIIATLLNLNYEYKDDKDNTSQTSIENIADNIFHEFHQFLYQQLPREKLKKFQKKLYVDYSKFRHIWENKFAQQPVAKKEYNPDISWHVIRTYIKGYGQEKTDPEDYNELPAKVKSVSNETFKKVYDNVWKWYKNTDYWDDQDLSCYLLKKDIIKSKYPVIFCDEAQDFTRIELELILHLNLFYDRKIYPQMLSRIPIAFAGDEFQTLNPTGFRWDQVKAAFVDKLIKGLDPASRSGKSDINFCELFYNYRSGKQIVNLCNIIQMLRCALFDIRKTELQQYWGEAGNTVSPQYFSIEHKTSSIQEALAKNPELVVIVPCLKDEEVAFVKNDKFLNTCIECKKDKDDVEIAPRVYSSERIKGLEYEQAVIYGFGENLPISIKDAIEQQAFIKNDQVGLQEEYFFNRLYVAVSRPRKRLFIIDSKKGINDFWIKLRDGKLRDKLAESVKTDENTKLEAASIDAGVVNFLSEQIIDSFSMAEQSYKKGCASKDSYLLRQAAISYENAAILPEYNIRKLEFEKKAILARAKANYFDGDFSKAASLFLNAEKYEDAMHAFWNLNSNEGWEGIILCAEKDRQLENTLEAHIARFVKNSDHTIENFNELLQTAANQGPLYEETFLSDLTWSTIFTELLQKFRDIVKDSKKNIIKLININLDKLNEYGIEIKALDLRALYYFYAGKNEETIEFYEKTNSRPKEYWLAKLALTKYPESIVPMYQLGNFDKIYYKKAFEQYLKHRKVTLSQNQIKIMSQICLNLDKLKPASEVLSKVNNLVDIFKVIQELKRENKKKAMLAISELFINKCLSSNIGNTAFNFIFQHNKPIELSNGEIFNPGDLKLPESDLKHLRKIFIQNLIKKEYLNASFYNYWRLALILDKNKEYQLEEKVLGLLASALVKRKRYTDFFDLFHENKTVNLADIPEELELSTSRKELSLPKNANQKILMYWVTAISKIRIDENEFPNKLIGYINNDVKQLIHRYEKEENIPNRLPLVFIGALVENGLGYSNTSFYKINFYKNIMQYFKPGMELIFIYTRLAILYAEFAEYLKSKGKLTEAEKYLDKLNEIHEILASKVISKIPRYVNVFYSIDELVKKILPNTKVAIENIKKIKQNNNLDDENAKIGDNPQTPITTSMPKKDNKLIFRQFPKRNRLRIENREGDQITLDISSMTLKSDDVEVKKVSKDHFLCPSWNLNITVKGKTVFTECSANGKQTFELG